MMKYKSISTLALFFLITTPCLSQSYQEKIEAAYSGDIAYETTAFVEQHWRVVGNKGFDASIEYVANQLESHGYKKEEEAAPTDRLTYRIEKRALSKPTWEPVNASLIIGEDTVLEFESNRNMIAINSHSVNTQAEVIYVEDPSKMEELDIKGKIVFVASHPYRVYKTAFENGAIGLLSYSNPGYLQPEKNTTSIQFRTIPLDTLRKTWCIALSYQAKERIKALMQEGTKNATVNISTNIYPSEELTLVADVKGAINPEERLVFSAHVQEPGANDNASGVGVTLEMAAVTAKLLNSGDIALDKTLTFLWGDEIISTRRYVSEDEDRAKNIKWGFSMDMVGENTALTGGSFLIEKMPDPSAIWTRGSDEHTEWGAGDVSLEDMQPHYLNDFVINRFGAYGAKNDWQVKPNPFEGGSDHVPFLRKDIPAVLYWHFTDQFYHTDNDRLDKVSQATLRNVGINSLSNALILINCDESTAIQIVKETEKAGKLRMEAELEISLEAIADKENVGQQKKILEAWKDWYVKAIASCEDLIQDSKRLKTEIKKSQKRFTKETDSLMKMLE